MRLTSGRTVRLALSGSAPVSRNVRLNMKTKILFSIILCVCSISCTFTTHRNHIEGEPVYKFIDFGEISEDTLKFIKETQELRHVSDKDQKEAIVFYEKMLKSELKDHYDINVVRQDGKEISIYIPVAVYQQLWKTDPQELLKENRSHHLSMDFKRVQVDEMTFLKGINIVVTLIDKKPIVKK